MDFIKLTVGDKVKMRKKHPCGSDIFLVKRTGVDVRLECSGCGRQFMATREEILKKIKSIIKEEV